MKQLIRLFFLLNLLYLLSSCASFKSDMVGAYDQPAEKNIGAQPVSVLFIFSHYHQTKGFDAIPMMDYRPINGFNDLFSDALNELSNVGSYSTFMNRASDVEFPKVRAKRDSLIGLHDYVMKIRIDREKSFSKFFFGTIGSVVSATLAPIPYKQEYTFTLSLYSKENGLVKEYVRKADVTKWWQTFMLFFYPFHHEKLKKELLYSEMMHDLFKQIESEKVLQ